MERPANERKREKRGLYIGYFKCDFKIDFESLGAITENVFKSRPQQFCLFCAMLKSAK